MKRFTSRVAIAAVLSLASMNNPARAEPLKNIVLVHGAWVDASGWMRVYAILAKDGFSVPLVQPPETERSLPAGRHVGDRWLPHAAFGGLVRLRISAWR